MNSSCDVPYGHYFDYTLDRLSRAVSRVMSNALPHVIIIYLVLLLPAGSSDLPKGTTGSRIAFVWSCFGWGLHGFSCYHENGSLLHCLSTLTGTCSKLPAPAVYLCCTSLGVTSTGRYPASCPVKPGLSSPAVFRHLQPRSFVLLILKTERTPQKLCDAP